MRISELLTESTTPNRQLYKNAMQKLLKEYPEISIGGGIGLCAFACGKLKELLQDKVDIELIIGKGLVDTEETTTMFDIAKKQWHEIPPDDVRYDVAQNFLTQKRGSIGHCVAYDGKTIIDITSKQFGLPMFYTLEKFESLFKKVERDVNIHIKDIEDFGMVI